MKKFLLLLLIAFSSALNAQIFWQAKSSNLVASRGITQINFADANNVWAYAYDGVTTSNTIREFTKSTDGGNTWTSGIINFGSPLGVGSLEAIDATTAYAAGYPATAGQAGGIWKTTDSGATWTKQTTATFSGADAFTNFVTFWDANEGLCQGDPNGGYFEIYRTVDGGVNWTRVPSANIPAQLAGEYGYVHNFAVVGNTIWFGTNMGRIYKSVDKGINWTVAQSPLSDFAGAAVNGSYTFKDANNGILQSGDFEFWSTADGAATWEPIAANGILRNGDIMYVPGTENTYITSGPDVDLDVRGTSFSCDGGLNWESINDLGDTTNVNGFAFGAWDASTFLVGGFATSTTVNGMFKYVGATMGTAGSVCQPAATSIFTTEKFFNVSPNPTAGKFSLNGVNINQVQVTDVLGKVIFNNTYSSLSNVELNIAEYNAGIYFVKATNDLGNSSVVKVIKE